MQTRLDLLKPNRRAHIHSKQLDDALHLEKMDVEDGGKQPYMRDNKWYGAVQRTVTAQGEQKGMKTVLQERGVNTDGINAAGNIYRSRR